MLGCWRIHQMTCGRLSPTKGITYRSDASWVPELPIRFDLLVDHLSRVLIGKVSTARIAGRLLQGHGLGSRARSSLMRHIRLMRFKMPPLLLTLLDTPDFMSR